MCRSPHAQVLDNYLRQRAAGNGAQLYNGLFLRMEQKEGEEGPFTINFSNYEDGGKARAHDANVSPDAHFHAARDCRCHSAMCLHAVLCAA